MEQVTNLLPEFYYFNEDRVELVKNELICQIDNSIKQCERSARNRFQSALKSSRKDELGLNLQCICDDLKFRYICIKILQKKDNHDILETTKHFLTESTKLSYINIDLEYIVYLINLFHKYEKMQREKERRKERQDKGKQIPESAEEKRIPESTEEKQIPDSTEKQITEQTEKT